MPPTAPFHVRVYDGGQLVCDARCAGPVELGRQRDPAEPIFAARQADGRTRVVVARLAEAGVPRAAALIEPLTDATVRLTNLSPKAGLGLADGDLPPNATREATLPVLLTLGPRAVRVERDVPAEPDSEPLLTLAEAAVPPGRGFRSSRFPTLSAGDDRTALRWLQAALDVFESAAGTDQFFDRAARAVVEAAGMDLGNVYLFDEAGGWKAKVPTRPIDPPPSMRVLERVRQDKRTFWQSPRVLEAESLAGVQAVVAAPILDRAGRVLGALYGERRSALKPVTEAEARLVELLAGGVAAGLARLEQEKAALAARVRFEEFFGPELARHLTERPDLLNGRDAEVTVLFADVRGYSTASERLGPAGTVEWVRDVLTELSDCVRREGGVLVDYVGDELMAMWGAPEEQPDHAERAARAALAMAARLPGLNERWRAKVGAPVGVGVGVHTGTARVGNTGTPHKFKYGPLGHTVNLGSRVQGATKHLQVPLLVTGDTAARLGGAFGLRRLTKVKVVNIQAPVELYELADPATADWPDLKQGYETALAAFEAVAGQPGKAGELRVVSRALAALLASHQNDGPSLLLLSRAVNAMLPKAAPAEAVWELPGK
jgi:adenylate cyclase